MSSLIEDIRYFAMQAHGVELRETAKRRAEIRRENLKAWRLRLMEVLCLSEAAAAEAGEFVLEGVMARGILRIKAYADADAIGLGPLMAEYEHEEYTAYTPRLPKLETLAQLGEFIARVEGLEYIEYM